MSAHEDETVVMQTPRPGPEGLGRATTSVLLLAAGLIVLAVGTLCLYAKRNVLDSDRLSSAAISTLDHAEVRHFIANETATQAIERVPELSAHKGTLEQATSAVVATDEFKSLVRGAIVTAEDALLKQGVDNTEMQLQNVGALVRKQLAKVDPALAAQIPTDLNTRLANLGRAPALTNFLQAVKKVDVLGVILPPIAIGLLIASVAVGGDRRRATLRLGLGLLAWGLAGFVLMVITRGIALNAVPAGSSRDAAGPVWDEVLGPLQLWLLAVGALGLGLAVFAYWRGRSSAVNL